MASVVAVGRYDMGRPALGGELVAQRLRQARSVVDDPDLAPNR
jgi:hypothetical protein